MMLPFLKSRIGGADIDMMPNAFAFATVGGAAPNTLTASAIVQITGISVPVPVTVSVGQFRVLDATQTTVIQDWGTVGSIKKGQCLQLRQTSSNSYSGTTSMGVNVGKASVVWYLNTVSVTGGSASWGTPGTYYFTIPYYNTFNFDVYGAGGGGGGEQGYVGSSPYNGSAGAGGGYSQIYDAQTGGGAVNCIGWAGGGGGHGTLYNPGAAGGHGSAQGGDGNVYAGGAGGGAGGILYWPNGINHNGGNGGYGGRAYRSIGRGVITPGQTLVILVGGGGAPGANGATDYGSFSGPGYGGNGACYISWS